MEEDMSFSLIGFDVVVLVDSNDPLSAAVYRCLVQRLAREEILRGSASTGMHLQVLIPGKRLPISDELVNSLKENKSPCDMLFDHMFIIQPNSIDRFTMRMECLNELAGNTFGVLMKLDSDNPARMALRPLPIQMSTRMSYWSLGFASISARGEEFIRYLGQCYRALLRTRWSQRILTSDQTHIVGRELISRLVDSDLKNDELPRQIYKWAASFFCCSIDRKSNNIRSPADLLACLICAVDELAIRSQAISADLQNRPIRVPKPKDPRGWFKRLINRICFNRYFRWSPKRITPHNQSAAIASQKARLEVLTIPIMNIQLSIQQALHTPPERGSRYNMDLNRKGTWYRKWLEPVIFENHSVVLETIRDNKHLPSLESGGNPLFYFEQQLLNQLKISPKKKGLELVNAIDRLVKANGIWLQQIISMLEERAAPWWSESRVADAEEYTFVLVPQNDYSRILEKANLPSSTVPWEYDAYGVIRFIQGCKPEVLQAVLPDVKTEDQSCPRRWVTSAETGNIESP